MAELTFSGIGITGLAAAVPANRIDNYAYTEHFPADDVREIVDKTGIKERRFALPHQCASDFCFAAADRLLIDLEVDREGRFVGGKVIPIYQQKTHGPKIDGQNRAVKKLIDLTKQDFPNTELQINLDGTLGRK